MQRVAVRPDGWPALFERSAAGQHQASVNNEILWDFLSGVNVNQASTLQQAQSVWEHQKGMRVEEQGNI